jgi:cytochrome c-type biogenesis protein CcmH
VRQTAQPPPECRIQADEIDAMMLWFALALMTGAAMAAIAWPLTRQARTLRSGSDLAVYRDQLEEVRRDHAAGRIGDSEADAAQVEVSRRLLAAADAEAAQAAMPAPGSRRREVALAALFVVSFGSAGTYLSLGSPSLPGQPLASRDPGQSIDGMIAQVEGHLARNPNDGRGWEVIAPVYLRIGRIDDAIKARRNALALNGETSERQAGLGEALVAQSDGKVTPEAKKSFARAVELDGGNIKARYFMGVAAEQDGQPAAAVEIWRAMLAGAPPDAPWAEFIRQEVARLSGAPGASAPAATAQGPSGPGPIAPGPSAEDVAAASKLAPDQQMAMIKTMVTRLADRLQQDGSDSDGWLRLVRAYMVLGDRDKALAAVGDARRALASEPEKLRKIEELVKGLGLEG